MTQQALKTLFLVSPIGPLGSEVRQDADDFRAFIVEQCSAVKDHYKVERADDINEPGRITAQVIQRIEQADLVH